MNEIQPIDNKIELLKKTVCKGATNDEFELFMHACRRTKLDPFMKQIYSIKRGDTRTIQTSIDGFRLIAERSGCYAPGREPSYEYKPDGSVLSATAYVKKKGEDDTWHEVAATAFWDEYAVPNGTFWKKMPRLMLGKCAESLALRKAFPADLSGMYTEDEMEQSQSPTIEVQPEEDEKVISDIEILKLAFDLSNVMEFSCTDRLDEYLQKAKKTLSTLDNPLKSLSNEKFVKGYESWLANNKETA